LGSIFNEEVSPRTRPDPERDIAGRLSVAWAGGVSNAAVWIVQEKGSLKKQGVTAEFISVNASPMALQAMIAGEVDAIVTSVTTLVNSRLAGADVVMIGFDRADVPRAHRHAEKCHGHKTNSRAKPAASAAPARRRRSAYASD
jgi:hypothetical protein